MLILVLFPVHRKQLRFMLSQLHPWWVSWHSSLHLKQIMQWTRSPPSPTPSAPGWWLKPSSSSFGCPEGEEGGEGSVPSSWEKVQVLALLLSLVTRRLEAKGWAGAGGFPNFSLSEVSDFLFRNSFRLLAFLLTWDGLSFFFVTCAVNTGVACFLSLASREKEKSEPTEKEKEKAIPWLASAWQKSMHLMAKEEFPPLGGADAVIVESYFWTMKFELRTSWIDMFPSWWFLHSINRYIDKIVYLARLRVSKVFKLHSHCSYSHCSFEGARHLFWAWGSG